ncbi:MAG TPA: CPBP family intramembrane glutamic endopeptidase [Allosphingosinicella sp.]|jgi:membrane protease YdiL (CAAX protease family)
MFARLRDRHPVAAAIACAVLQFGLTVAILVAGKALIPAEKFGAVKLVAFASTLLLPVMLAQVLGLWRELGLQRIGMTPFFFISLLVCVPYLLLGLRVPADASIGGAVTIQAFNAFGEELLFRGVIFALLLRLPLARALIINGLLFGAMHLIHGIMEGDWAAASHQALVTVLGGLIFTAVRAETGSLWPPIVLHMLVNLSIIFSDDEAARAAGTLTFATWASRVFEISLVLWLLWKARGGGVDADPGPVRKA